MFIVNMRKVDKVVTLTLKQGQNIAEMTIAPGSVIMAPNVGPWD